jgi:hypothetical protein
MSHVLTDREGLLKKEETLSEALHYEILTGC